MSEGRAWTQDDVAKLVAMLRDGRTTEEAANALGRTVPAIWQYMRYHRQAFQGRQPMIMPWAEARTVAA